MVHVPLSWTRIDWLPHETFRKDTLPKLIDAGIKEVDLRRCVYVIRLNGEYCIDYPSGTSPTLYIGEGSFNQRITSHRIWVRELEEFVGDFSFQIYVGIPRVRKNIYAYKDCEAALLDRFCELFGSAPLWNKQFERRRHEHYFYSQSQLDQALRKGSGKKYKWAFRPMKSSPFYDQFMRTHSC